MGEAIDIDRDIAILQSMIDGSDADLLPFLDEHPQLGTVQAARDDLSELIMRLKEVRAGHVVPHAEVVRDVEARRRRHRIAAE